MKNPFDLLQSSKNIFTVEMIKKISVLLNEDEHKVQKAITVIIPTILYGLSEKASTWYGASDIAHRAADAYKQDVLNNVDNLFTDRSEAYLFLLTDFFGKKSADIISTIAAFSGIKYPSVSSLFSFCMPAILAILGERKAYKDTNAMGLAASLIFHKNDFVNDLPDGISLVDAEDEFEEVNEHSQKKYSRGWMFGLTLLAASVLFLIWLLASNNRSNAEDINGKINTGSSIKAQVTINNTP